MSAWGLRKGRSRGVHDDLKARALVLDDGNARIAIVSLDVLFVYKTLTDEIRKRVKTLTGIEESNVMLAASHTHTSPEMGGDKSVWAEHKDSHYLEVFPEYVAGTVAAADALLEPASLAASSSELRGVTVNRRHPDQPVDATLGVLKVVRRSGGGAIAELINFGCHPVVVGGQYLLWSADFPGPACSFVEREIKGSVCLYANGASGDVHPWDMYFGNENTMHPPTHEEAERLGTALGSAAIRVAGEAAAPKDALELRAKTVPITLTKRKIPSEDEAQKVLDGILKRFEPWTKDTWDPGDNVSTIFGKHPGQYMISSAQSLLALAKNREPEISTEIQAFGLGDTALVAIPGELFSNLGLEVRRRSGARETFIMGYANDEINYIPTVEAIEECEDLELEEGFGLKYTYGATLPVTTVSKEAVGKITAAAVEMATQITRAEA